MAALGGGGIEDDGTGTALVPAEFAGLGHLPFVDAISCKIDPKSGRMTLPSHLRPAFVDGHAHLRNMKEGWVNIWTPLGFVRWEKALARKREKSIVGPRTRQRAFASSKALVIDRQGRLVLPVEARTHLGVETELIVAGCGDHIELWLPSAWESEVEEFDAFDMESETYDGLDLETGE